MTLTEAGRLMLDAGRQAITRLETERAQIRESIALPDQYVVVFGAQHSIGWRFYPAWLQHFESAFGPFPSRLRADDLPRCIEDLRQGEIDFLIAYESDFAGSMPPTKGSETLLIGRDKLIPVSKADDMGRPLFDLSGPSDKPIPYLRFGDVAPINRHIEPMLRVHGLHDRLRVIYENSMAGALRIRVRDGAGIAWLPHSLVRPDLESGQVQIAGPSTLSIELRVRMHRLTGHANETTAAIWSFLSEHNQLFELSK